jgi:hypothetical protein
MATWIARIALVGLAVWVARSILQGEKRMARRFETGLDARELGRQRGGGQISQEELAAHEAALG